MHLKRMKKSLNELHEHERKEIFEQPIICVTFLSSEKKRYWSNYGNMKPKEHKIKLKYIA